MTIKRRVSREELAKLDSFVVIVSNGMKFYTGLVALRTPEHPDITAVSEAIKADSAEEAMLKAQVMFPDKLMIDVVRHCKKLGMHPEDHYCGAVELLKDSTIAYEIEV